MKNTRTKKWNLRKERKRQQQCKRLKTIAYNAIVKWREDAMEYYIEPEDERNYILEELGISDEEYAKIVED